MPHGHRPTCPQPGEGKPRRGTGAALQAVLGPPTFPVYAPPGAPGPVVEVSPARRSPMSPLPAYTDSGRLVAGTRLPWPSAGQRNLRAGPCSPGGGRLPASVSWTGPTGGVFTVAAGRQANRMQWDCPIGPPSAQARAASRRFLACFLHSRPSNARPCGMVSASRRPEGGAGMTHATGYSDTATPRGTASAPDRRILIVEDDDLRSRPCAASWS